MRLTIDIDRLSETEAYAFRNGVVGGYFHRVLGEAVTSAMAKARSFKEDNEAIAIDSHIAGFVDGEIGDINNSEKR